MKIRTGRVAYWFPNENLARLFVKCNKGKLMFPTALVKTVHQFKHACFYFNNMGEVSVDWNVDTERNLTAKGYEIIKYTYQRTE